MYLAEHLLGAPVDAVSATVDSTTDGDAVEGLALCRLEAGRRIGMVNIGWGLGPGGIAVNGTKGRAVAHYRADGTMPWAPFERLVMTTVDGTRTIPLPQGRELVLLVADAMRETVADLAAAISERRPPAADGVTALRILEATVAAYTSAALRRTIELPPPTDNPLHRAGVVGLRDLDLPDTSPVRRLPPATRCTQLAGTATIRCSVVRCNSPRNSRSKPPPTPRGRGWERPSAPTSTQPPAVDGR